MRWPVDNASVTSSYGARRADNVRHWGLDLGGHAGDEVYAPEAGFIVASSWGRGTAVALPSPLNGYGPGAVLIRGESGVYHLLAHLDPTSHPTLVAGTPIAEGALVGRMPTLVGRAGPHTHWEVRVHEPYDSPVNREANTMDPRAWLRGEDPATAQAEWRQRVTGQGTTIVPPSLTTQVIDAVATSRSAPSKTTASSGVLLVLVLLLLARGR